jgi:hypothetical protein
VNGIINLNKSLHAVIGKGGIFMNMIKIVCPKCSAEAKLSLVDPNFTGPRRCWKCHELFSITIKNGAVISSEPMSEEDYQKQEQAKAAKEGVTNLNFSTPGKNDDDIPRLSPERRRNYNRPLNSPAADSKQDVAYKLPAEPAAPAEPPKPKEPTLPYDRPRTFIPMADDPPAPKKEPEIPAKPKDPKEKKLSDMPRAFIPPAT